MTITHLDYSDLQGGLARMLDRFREEGTLTGKLEADDYLRASPTAALLGLLYDQRVRAEYAFTGPIRLRDRLGHLDLAQIAAHDAEAFNVLFAEPPAVHRFTNKMADQTQTVAQQIIDLYDGDPARLWNDGAEAEVISKRVQQLVGFGKQKAAKMIYVLHYLGYRSFA
ncbi:MAG: hypothetical protein AAF970_02755 [Bacteroidota bacterium]